MRGHELIVTNGIVFQNLRKFGLHFRKLIPGAVKWTSIYKTQKDHPPRNFHTLPRITTSSNDPRLSPSIPRKYARNFRTQTTPLDPAALDRQNTKISVLKMPPRAATCHKKFRRSQPQTHAPPHATFIISRTPTCDALTHAPSAMTSWMMSSSTTQFDSDWPENLTRSEQPEKKVKKK